nr:MAG TPA: hypothetical protein [Caudoviricetes sp.]
MHTHTLNLLIQINLLFVIFKCPCQFSSGNFYVSRATPTTCSYSHFMISLDTVFIGIGYCNVDIPITAKIGC